MILRRASVFGLIALLAAGVGCSDDDDNPVNPIVDTGTLSVTTVTTGDDIDSDGYTLMIDGSQSGSIGANATRSFPDFVVGPYLVELSGVAANCTVSGSNPRTENITKDATTTTRFDVSCQAVPPPGPASIEILSGNNQTAAVGTALDDPLQVAVKDAAGDGVQGVEVTFTVTEGGGTILVQPELTSPAGITVAFYEVGPAPGTNTIVAAVASDPSISVTFTATGQ